MESRAAKSKTERKTTNKEVAKRPEILALAKEAFATHGYPASALRDISLQAGVTAAAIYYYFPSKEDMLSEIVLSGLERIQAAVVGARSSANGPVARLESVIRAHLDFCAQNPAETKIITEDSRFLNPRDFAVAREKQIVILNIYRTCIREIIDEGVIPETDPTILAFNIISVILGWYRWFRTDRGLNVRQTIEATARFAVAGVLGLQSNAH